MVELFDHSHPARPAFVISWYRWMTTPDRESDEEIRAELVNTICGNRSTIVFSMITMSVLICCLGWYNDARHACLFAALCTACAAWRLLAVGTARHTASYGSVLTAGLAWAAAIGVVTAEAAHTDQTMLVAFGGIIAAAHAFGAGSNNAGAPRFAKLMTALFIVPYSISAGFEHGTGMLVIVLQLPLWLFGTFAMIERTHAAHADLIRAQRLSEHLAYHDALTGLPNRARFMERLATECDGIRQLTKAPSYVLYLDLDGFKRVNDTLGHGAGDDLLRAVGARFLSIMRLGDVLGRLGGDEFAAILSDVTTSQVEAVGASLIQAAKEPFLLDGLPAIQIGVSIGGAKLTPPSDLRRALHAADTMLYAAKHAGKGAIRLA